MTGLLDDDWDEELLVDMVVRCHREVDRARVDRDLSRLGAYVGPALYQELTTAWGGRPRGYGPPAMRVPRVRLLTVVNAYEPELAWCTAELRVDGVSPLSGMLRNPRKPEFWTFRRDHGRWKLVAIDAAVTARSQDPGVHSASVFELAAADAMPESPDAARLSSSSSANAAEALADLSLVDGRFVWHVVTEVIDRILVAWTAAAELGTDAPLLAFAEPTSARALVELSGSATTRPLRELRLVQAEPLAVRELPAPSKISVRVTIEARPGVRRWAPLRRAADPTPIVARWVLRLDARRPGGWCLERATALPR